jgi:hypothetical protein
MEAMLTIDPAWPIAGSKVAGFHMDRVANGPAAANALQPREPTRDNRRALTRLSQDRTSNSLRLTPDYAFSGV